MNALTTTANQDEVIRVLGNSLYPGAKPESIALVLAYCRANGLDPFLKPCHIVPTSVKTGDKYEMRDVLMPGIADYRIKASRSGEYIGKTEPEFGPDKTENLSGMSVTYPEWCRITVRRLVQGKECEFTAKEYWIENYATAKRDTTAPNTMWRKRRYGQLAKCTEAQALRMAFPEFSGGAPTAEEMEGKTLDEFSGPTIDAKVTPVATPVDRRSAWVRETEAKLTAENSGTKWLALLRTEIATAPTREDAEAVGEFNQIHAALESAPEAIRRQIEEILADAVARFADGAAAPTIENDPKLAPTDIFPGDIPSKAA